MSLIKKGLSDSKYYLIANVGNKAFAFLIIPILARIVGVEGFATYDLFLIISSFFHILVILGIDSGIAILLAESKNDTEKLSFFYVVSLLISFALVLFLSLIFITIFLFVDELFLLNRDVWIYIGFYVFFTMINYHTFNFLRWREKAKEASFVTLFAYISGMLIGLYFLYVNRNIESYLEGLVIGLFIGTVVSIYIAREYIFSFKLPDNYKELLSELFKLSLPFVPNYLGGNLMKMADRIVILILFGKYELGIYALIMKLAMIPQFIIGTVTGGFLPVMFHNYKTEKGALLIKNFFHTYLLLIPVSFVVAYFLSDWAVEIFAGIDYLESAYLLPMGLVSILFVYSTQANGFGYSIMRKTHQVMYITFLSVLVNYIFSFMFAYWMGLQGIIIGTLIAGIFRTYVYTLYSEKLYSFNYNFKFIIFISILSFLLVILALK